jgi:glycosyltransferase involved in cell wall biosynthesis
MRVSIIITLYNRLEMCLRLLYKLEEQIEKNHAEDQVQVIVLNDGSTEEQVFLKPIEYVCDKFGFEYHYQENAGEAAARNAGKNLSKGDYFTYLDCDDDMVPEYLQNILESMKYGYDAVAYKWVYRDTGEVGVWHDRPLVNWNVWSWIYKTSQFQSYDFDTNRIIASDYFWLEECFKDRPYLKVCYADDKKTIIYNADNKDNLSNRFARGEVKANREEK